MLQLHFKSLSFLMRLLSTKEDHSCALEYQKNAEALLQDCRTDYEISQCRASCPNVGSSKFDRFEVF